MHQQTIASYIISVFFLFLSCIICIPKPTLFTHSRDRKHSTAHRWIFRASGMGPWTQTRACGVILLGKDRAGNIPSKSAEEIRDLWKVVGGLWMGKAERKTCEKWNSVALPKQEEALVWRIRNPSNSPVGGEPNSKPKIRQLSEPQRRPRQAASTSSSMAMQ